VLLDTVREGDCLGEIAIFHPNKASATVTGLQAGELWMIDAAALQEFLLTWPNDACAVILGINIILSRRLKKANSLIRANEIVPSFLSVRSQKHVKAGNKD
jgi:CRP-like cAMP-binding protein